MLSKITILSLAIASQNDAFVSAETQGRATLQSLRNTPHHPLVKDGDCANGGAAVTRLKKGPADIPVLVAAGAQYVDQDFTTPDALFWNGYETTNEESAYDTGLADGTFTWQRWSAVSATSQNKLFTDTTDIYLDPNQGGAGTCYFIAAIAAAGEWPDMITDMFVTGTSDSAIGLYGIQFYIRGKPWVVTVDDKLLFENGALKYSQASDAGAMWAPILEKAWAKAKGTYGQTNGGFVVSGLRSLTGAPTFTYQLSTYGLTTAQTFSLLDAANTANYPMGAGTGAGSDATFNDCGIAYGHAYSILTTFSMSDDGGTNYDMVMLRNPWGITYYSGTWHKSYSSWTDTLVAQVPWSVDPRTSDSDGIFVMAIADFVNTGINCLTGFEISHVRDSEGYKDAMFDKEGDDGDLANYYVTVPASDGALYFSAESYYQDLVPNECTSGTYQGYSLPNPVVDITLYEDGSNTATAYKLYADQFNYPLLITSYSAGVVWTISVKMTWFGSPSPDYTVKVYSKQSLEILDSAGSNTVVHYDGNEPSGFTSSTYRGMYVGQFEEPEEPVEDEICSLADMFDEARLEGGFYYWKLLMKCLTNPNICLNPLNWIDGCEEEEEDEEM